jgi:hypothetical protein
MRFRTLTLFALLSGAIIAGPLSGSGNNLIVPATGSTSPGIAPVITFGTGSFTGSWTSTAALAPWQGTFSGTGDYPCCGNAGTTTWTFAGMPSSVLAVGTYFRLGDLDSGETLRFTAFNASNQAILTPWLDEAIFASSNNPGDFNALNYPGWSFDTLTGTYTFTGRSGVNGNTLLTITLPTNIAIGSLVVNQPDSTAGFTLAAPESAVPEPGTYALMSASLGALLFYRRRQRQA